MSEDNMSREVPVGTGAMPFEGTSEFNRGERNYMAFANGQPETPLKIHIAGEEETLLSEDSRTVDTYLEHLGSRLRSAKAQVNIARQKEDGKPGQAAKNVLGIQANLVGFGNKAWENENRVTALKAFDLAGVLSDEAVQGMMVNYVTSKSDRNGRLKFIRALQTLQRQRQHTGEKMEDIRQLLLLIREYSVN